MNSTPNPNTFLKIRIFRPAARQKHKFSNLPFVRAHYTIRKTRKPLKSVLQIPSNLPFVRTPYTIRKTRNLQNERRRGLKKTCKMYSWTSDFLQNFMKSCIRFAENISFSASTHKIYKSEDAKNLMFKNTFCMGFCPQQAENF